MRTFTTVVLGLLAVTLVAGQRYQPDDGNYINGEVYGDYESDQPAARPVHSPTPRSYSPAQAAAQRGPAAAKPTPVAILKQINRHNEDGSYTYGFEGADGSFKIETKLANGEVKGKYGFVDDSGKVRVVEYGADQYGFQPSGEGITVAPPTLVDETTSKEALEAAKYGQDYAEYQLPIAARPPPPRAAPARQQTAAYQQQYQPQFATAAHTQAIYAAQSRAVPKPAPQAIFTPADQPSRSQLSAALQSQLIQQQQLYEEQPQAIQYAKNGPVQFGPAPVQERPRPQPQTRSGNGGLLDQLARDYALPSNAAAPLHDISFGYY
ncbi:uncharacterized protein LOC131663108 [Phymastichus coffea]|uniref:uncharacterized protein LOC131663108 n=1 Tax=Phymastichus coffea TaxID=108790 RepID=UPI00273C1A55|nr:uncharacterized protein LOC131663108 [Phymastichus coffea]